MFFENNEDQDLLLAYNITDAVNKKYGKDNKK